MSEEQRKKMTPEERRAVYLGDTPGPEAFTGPSDGADDAGKTTNFLGDAGQAAVAEWLFGGGPEPTFAADPSPVRARGASGPRKGRRATESQDGRSAGDVG